MWRKNLNIPISICNRQLYTRLELECAGSAAALERLRSLCSSLDDARNQRRRAVTDLRNRLRKIQEFAQVAVSSTTPLVKTLLLMSRKYAFD